MAMGEQNKVVQSGAAMCMVKMVEYAAKPPVSTFQKLCPKICRLLNNPNFLYKASLCPSLPTCLRFCVDFIALLCPMCSIAVILN